MELRYYKFINIDINIHLTLLAYYYCCYCCNYYTDRYYKVISTYRIITSFRNNHIVGCTMKMKRALNARKVSKLYSYLSSQKICTWCVQRVCDFKLYNLLPQPENEIFFFCFFLYPHTLYVIQWFFDLLPFYFLFICADFKCIYFSTVLFLNVFMNALLCHVVIYL